MIVLLNADFQINFSKIWLQYSQPELLKCIKSITWIGFCFIR